MTQAQLIDPAVHGKLQDLRSALRRRLLAEGLAWLAASLVAAAFASLGLDYGLKLERPLRAAVLGILGLGVLWVLWRQILRPLAVRMDEEALALLAERKWPQLGDRLISAMQFARGGGHLGGASREMVNLVTAQADELVRPLDLREIVERSNLRRVRCVAACAVVMFAGFSLWQGRIFHLWVMRNLAMANVDWPQKTYLKVEGTDFAVSRGDDLKVVISAEDGEVVPSSIDLHVYYRSVGWTEEKLELASNGNGNGNGNGGSGNGNGSGSGRKFVKVFQAVAEPFDFYVTGGDDALDRRRPHSVDVIDPPDLRQAQFKIEYPAYMARESRTLDGSMAALGVPVGSVVSVMATATKDIRGASILIDGKEVGKMRITNVAGEGGQAQPRGLIGSFEVTHENKAVSRSLKFALTDTGGFTNRRGAQYLLQVQPDLAPIVDLKKRGVGTAVTPTAIIPLAIQVRDDCGVVSLSAQVTESGKAASQPAQAVKINAGLREISALHGLELAKYGLKPGDAIQVYCEATDTLPGGLGGPNVARSAAIEFRITKPEELLAEMIRRQKELRLELVQAVAMQEESRSKTAAVADALASAGVTEELRTQLASSAALQSTVGSECVKVADALAVIIEEMRNNQLAPEATIEQTVQEIVVPLRRLVEKYGEQDAPVPQVAAALNAARVLDQAAALKDQTSRIAAVQGDIRARMEKILERMIRGQSRLELANEVKVLIGWSEQLYKNIKEQEKADVVNIFDEPKNPATKPAGK